MRPDSARCPKRGASTPSLDLTALFKVHGRVWFGPGDGYVAGTRLSAWKTASMLFPSGSMTNAA
jgi:hypothetical protein